MLPVLEIENTIIAGLARSNRLVLTAPTGSGKTTQVPQILLRSGLMDATTPRKGADQIVVLQPRRLATRMVARRVAQELGTSVGGLVGYQTRHDSMIGPDTRIRFLTEGLLLRLLQSDPMLRGVGAVVLDEFHERNLAADISLALVKRLQQTQRPELKLVVMSATLDAAAVASYLDCESLEAGGRLFPIEIQYAAKPSQAAVWDRAAAALREVLTDWPGGDVLIFMPGVYEINKTIAACRRAMAGVDQKLEFHPLHGSLRPAEQDAAVNPAARGVRKVVVSTNVAETSLTIEGVRIVIDSGLAKIHRYEPRREMNVLRTEAISKASADQRAGRAGRTSPGMCIRLWTQREHAARADHELPEVKRLELSETVLQLKSMGVLDVAGFPWFESPDAGTIKRAEELLRMLGAVDAAGASLTSLGGRMAKFPAHPRVSRMLMEAAKRNCLGRATMWAALIGDRDIFNSPERRVLLRFLEKDDVPSDLLARERAMDHLRAAKFDARHCSEIGASATACRDVDQTARSLASVCRRMKLSLGAPGRTEDLIKSLLVAFPDHIANKLDEQRPNCAMAGRKRIVLDRESIVQEPGLLLALEIRETGQGEHLQTQLALATRIEAAWLEEVHPHAMETRTQTIWNPQTQAVEEVEEYCYCELVISRKARPQVDPVHAAEVFVEQILAGNLKLEHWDERVEQWIARVRFVARHFPERHLILYDNDDLRVILLEIIAPGKPTRFNQIRDRPCMNAVRDALSWDDQQFVAKMAPESIQLPGPRKWPMKLEYPANGPPKGRAKIQDLYGLNATPRVAGGRQEILLEILGPNYRPVQVTSDLKNFWQTLYPELKKELKRRYPRHEWR